MRIQNFGFRVINLIQWAILGNPQGNKKKPPKLIKIRATRYVNYWVVPAK